MKISLKKKQGFWLALVLLLVMILVPAVCFADAEKIFRENNKAVVVVVAYDAVGKAISQGSGFIVRRDGVIVTNYHVISNARSIKIKAGNKTFNVEGLINLDKENDIAILKINVTNLPIVKLGNLAKSSIGEKVYVIGSPKGLENTISDGILSGKREIAAHKVIIQITAPVSPGSSGGPLFNKNGEVIGVVTFLLKEAQNLNFAMPVDAIKNKITANKATAIKKSKIEDYEKTSVYWFYRGVAYDDAGKYKEAVESYKQAIRLKPDFAAAFLNIGFAYYKLGRYQEAVEADVEAIRIDPNFATAHYNLGNDYQKLGRYQEAVEAYGEAIRIDPNFSAAHYNMGVAYGMLGRYQEEVAALKQAIRIDPNFAMAYNNLGFAYYKLGRVEEQIDTYKQAIRIAPDYAIAHLNLGLIYLALGDRSAAIDEYKILKKLDETMAEKLFNLIYK